MLLQQVRAGSSDAAWQLIDLYWPHIYRVVHRRMDSRLRSGFDSEDFVQAVWLSFFKDPGKIHSFESSGQLIAYLVRMANNKILEEHRRNLASSGITRNSRRPWMTATSIAIRSFRADHRHRRWRSSANVGISYWPASRAITWKSCD